MRRLVVPTARLVLLVVLGWPRAGRADDACVRLRAGATVRARAGGDAVGRATRRVAGRVVERGDVFRIEIESLRGEPGRRTPDGKVTVAAARRDVQAARCPAGPDMLELGLRSDFLELRWRDGGAAGWTHPGSVVDAASASRERVQLDGEAYVCFDDPVVAGLTVHLCGSCAQLRAAAGPGLGLGGRRLPCDD